MFPLLSVILTASAAVVPLHNMGFHYGISVDVEGFTLSGLLLHTGPAPDLLVFGDALPPSLVPPDSQHLELDIVSDLHTFKWVDSAVGEFNVSLVGSAPLLASVWVSAFLLPPRNATMIDNGVALSNGLIGVGPWSGLFGPGPYALNLTTDGPQLQTGEDVVVEGMVWSEYQPYDPSTSGYTFTMYSPGSCGVVSLPNATSHVVALVNTTSACLTLPEELFHAVVGWLPLVCGTTSGDAHIPNCALNGSAANASSPLPLLHFQLADDPESPVMYIDLVDLLLESPASTAYPRVCLLKGGRLGGGLSPRVSPVVLGTMPLRSFLTVLDPTHRRVGFSNIRPPVAPATVSRVCKPLVECVGEQHLYVPGNTCESPQCTARYCQTLDNASQTCVFTLPFKVFALLILIAAISLETFVFVSRRRLDAACIAGEFDDRPAHQRGTTQRPLGVGGVGNAFRLVNRFSRIAARRQYAVRR